MKWVPVQTLNQQKSDGTNLTCKRRISTNVRPVKRSDQYNGQTSTKVRPVQRSDQYERLIVPVRLLYQSPTFVPVRRLYCTIFVPSDVCGSNLCTSTRKWFFFKFSIQMVTKKLFEISFHRLGSEAIFIIVTFLKTPRMHNAYL